MAKAQHPPKEHAKTGSCGRASASVSRIFVRRPPKKAARTGDEPVGSFAFPFLYLFACGSGLLLFFFGAPFSVQLPPVSHVAARVRKSGATCETAYKGSCLLICFLALHDCKHSKVAAATPPDRLAPA